MNDPAHPAGDPGPPLRLRLRVLLPDGVPFGPGKADLLEGIRDLGSIAAAGRRLNMSYQRAWALVAVMNAQFRSPLVAASKGGARGGGATLTALGHDVLAAYRGIEALSAAASGERLDWLRRQLAKSGA